MLEIIQKIVDYGVSALAIIFMGVLAFRVFTGYWKDDDRSIWKAIFWGVIVMGFFVAGDQIGELIKSTWLEIVSG